jgi:hypothetical protein
MTDPARFRCAECGAGHAYAQTGRCLFCDGPLEPVAARLPRRRREPLRAERKPAP